jgi:hypothetical protein
MLQRKAASNFQTRAQTQHPARSDSENSRMGVIVKICVIQFKKSAEGRLCLPGGSPLRKEDTIRGKRSFPLMLKVGSERILERFCGDQLVEILLRHIQMNNV